MSKDGSKKTKAKRMGVKSVFVHGDKELTITSFGNGNAAEIAVRTDAAGSNLPQPALTGRFTTKSVAREGIDTIGSSETEKLETMLHNPTEDLGSDYLGLKGTLEREFFGKEFPTDNVRIQIIHNILDIQKLLGIYVNDIIYSVNNLQDITEGETLKDVVGLDISVDKRVKKFLENMEPFLGYFGDGFKRPPSREKNTKGETMEERESRFRYNAAVLRVLGAIRQCTAHFDKSHVLLSESEQLKEHLMNVEEYKFNVDWSVLDRNYRNKIDDINKDFMKNAARNLHLIHEALGAKSQEEKKRIAQEYYRFSILKEGKNLGVNMRKLREMMFDDYRPDIKDKKHDSYRQKIYMIADYFLFRCLQRNPGVLEDMVAELRETSDESAKDEVYKSYTKLVWGMLTRMRILTVLKKFERGFPKELARIDGKNENSAWIDDVKFKSENAIPVVQILSFLCNFWEGKEINELLSAYIHKFENIQEFIDTIEKLEGKKPIFVDKYALFNEPGRDKDGNPVVGRRAGEIAQDLRVLASIGKMKPDLEGAKRLLFKAAIEMLGIPDDSDYVTDEWLEQNVLLGNEDRKDKKKTDQVNPFRNFIAKNVIGSRRFMYLVRYSKPKTVKALMQNPTIVRYVLTRIPETQVDSYYENLGLHLENPKAKAGYDMKCNMLCAKITGLSFDSLLENRDGIVTGTKPENRARKNVEIERLKALVGLYLTVAYIAIKNLVKANARYYIAFACFERDFVMFKRKLELSKDDWKFGNFDNYFALTEYFLDEDDRTDRENPFVMQPNGEKFGKQFRAFLKTIRHHFDKHAREYLRRNLDEAKAIHSTGWLLTAARNKAEHLHVLTELPKYVAEFQGDKKPNGPQPRNLYFQLYHYVLQRLLCEDEDLRESLAGYAEKVIRQGGPSSDLENIIFISLGYNLARYKNLTVEGLFEKKQD